MVICHANQGKIDTMPTLCQFFNCRIFSGIKGQNADFHKHTLSNSCAFKVYPTKGMNEKKYEVIFPFVIHDLIYCESTLQKGGIK
jgi:hypothetical protein